MIAAAKSSVMPGSSLSISSVAVLRFSFAASSTSPYSPCVPAVVSAGVPKNQNVASPTATASPSYDETSGSTPGTVGFTSNDSA